MDRISIGTVDGGVVELYDSTKCNANEECRKDFVANIATLSYGNDVAKNPDALWDLLSRNGHSSCFEFIRTVYHETIGGSLRNETFPTDEDMGTKPEENKGKFFLFKIKTPIFVARQFMRHRGFSYLEMSRRYTKASKVPFEFYMADPNDETAKKFNESAVAEYDRRLSAGMKPEVARGCIPVDAYTVFWCMADKATLDHFFNLRCSPKAQPQMRNIAMEMQRQVEEYMRR